MSKIHLQNGGWAWGPGESKNALFWCTFALIWRRILNASIQYPTTVQNRCKNVRKSVPKRADLLINCPEISWTPKLHISVIIVHQMMWDVPPNIDDDNPPSRWWSFIHLMMHVDDVRIHQHNDALIHQNDGARNQRCALKIDDPNQWWMCVPAIWMMHQNIQPFGWNMSNNLSE